MMTCSFCGNDALDAAGVAEAVFDYRGKRVQVTLTNPGESPFFAVGAYKHPTTNPLYKYQACGDCLSNLSKLLS
jgi:hypothetical protein